MEKKTNLVYVFADQLRYDALGCNGSEIAHTPNIDRISKESLNLDNAISGHPVCAPYRASLFTGKYTTSTGMVINELRLNTNHESFADVLNASGYETCYIGKWHLYANQLGHHYDTKNSYIPKGPDRLGFNDVFAAYNFHHEYYAPNAYYHLDSDEKIMANGYEPDFMTDYAIDNLRRLANSEKPFALFLSLGTPHDPWTADNVPKKYYDMFDGKEFPLPKNYIDKNDRHADLWARLSYKERAELPEWMKVYAAMVANLDENIGKIYDELSNLSLLDNTIFIFTSDHGEMFGSHGRRAKNIFYDEAARVPFIIHYSNKLKNNRENFTFNTVDIMPSLLSMLELDIPSSVQGEDKKEYIFGKEGEHEDENEGSLLMGTGPTAIYGIGREWRAYRTKRYTYAIYKLDKEELLFDNLKDPLQMNNLAKNEAFKEIKEDLKGRMYKKMESIGDEFLSCLEYKRRYIKNRIIKDELPKGKE